MASGKHTVLSLPHSYGFHHHAAQRIELYYRTGALKGNSRGGSINVQGESVMKMDDNRQ